MNTPHDTLFTCQPEQLPWIPWAIKGTYFKLLNAEPTTGKFTILLKFTPGVVTPLHRHIGAVEGLMLEGEFYYQDDPSIRFAAGSYLLENDGAVHQPVSPDGAVMFALFHGPVEGLDDSGKTIGRLDCEWHVKRWNTDK